MQGLGIDAFIWDTWTRAAGGLSFAVPAYGAAVPPQADDRCWWSPAGMGCKCVVCCPAHCNQAHFCCGFSECRSLQMLMRAVRPRLVRIRTFHALVHSWRRDVIIPYHLVLVSQDYSFKQNLAVQGVLRADAQGGRQRGAAAVGRERRDAGERRARHWVAGEALGLLHARSRAGAQPPQLVLVSSAWLYRTWRHVCWVQHVRASQNG